jgi:hypothetical protein
MSTALTHLFKGPVYRDKQDKVWPALLKSKAAVVDYLAVLGLEVLVDETEGYAFVRSSPDRDEALPRLVRRHTLPFQMSLLVALLRKRLLEFDAANADPLLVMTKDQIVDMVRLFLPERSNEARLVDTIDRDVKRIVELGFLRRLPGEQQNFAVERIIKAFVDGQWLNEFDARLQEYHDELTRELTDELTDDMEEI